MNDAQNIYWLFTASAQTIAAFIAFVLAGYALVHTMMESAAQADETLIEIHESRKRQYHRYLSALVIITAFAILFSLIVVFLNAFQTVWVPILAVLSAFLITA
jgi:hypothetical protein